MGDAVNEMLGTVDHDVLTQLLAAIVAGNADKALAVISAYAERAPDFVGLVDELLKLIHRIAVEQAVPGAGSEGQLYRTFIHDYAGLISPEDLQLFYQSLLVGKRDLALAPDPITGMEMIVLRLFAFRIAPADIQLEQSSAQSVTTSSSQSEEVTPAKKLLAETAAEQTASVDAVSENHQAAASAQLSETTLNEPVETAPVAVASQSVTPPAPSPAASMRDNFDATPAYVAPVELAQPENIQAAMASESVNVGDTVNVGDSAVNAISQGSEEGTNPALDTLTPLSWCEIFAALPLSGVVRTVASYCVPIETSDEGASGQVVFALADDNATLFNDEHPARLAKGLSIYYGKPLTIKINIVEDWSSLTLPGNVETPADYRLRIKAEVQGEALASIQGDDNVKSIIDAFDGELDTDTVRSL